MRYKKRINNNVVVAIDEHGIEQIVTGKGIGFQIIPGGDIVEKNIEKIFTLKDSDTSMRLQELMKTIPIEHISFAEELIQYARMHIRNELNDNVLVALCDHMYMAIERKKQDIEVHNVMLWDIKKFYHDEFLVGEYAIEQIHEKFKVQLSEDEAGFIALHFVNAQLDVQSKSVKEITQLMQELETIVRMTFSITIDTQSLYYDRFITHLKFFAQRVFSGKNYVQQDVEHMLLLVQQKSEKEFACAKKIEKFMKEKYQHVIGDEEILYLCIHISRIVQISKRS